MDIFVIIMNIAYSSLIMIKRITYFVNGCIFGMMVRDTMNKFMTRTEIDNKKLLELVSDGLKSIDQDKNGRISAKEIKDSLFKK